VEINGVIEVVAGTPQVAGFSGDGGPATNAKLNGSGGIFMAHNQMGYIADSLNHAIRMVNTTDGNISTVAGIGTFPGFINNVAATSAKLFQPLGVFVDKNLRIFIADTGNHVIRMFDTMPALGNISTFAGTGTVAGFSGDGGQASQAKLDSPHNVAMDQFGRLFIADTNNAVIRMVDINLIISTVAGTPGAVGYSGDNGLAISAKFNGAVGINVDVSGRLYIPDFNNNVIRMIDRRGIITTVAGGNGSTAFGYTGDGGQATSALLNNCRGVFVDRNFRIHIADTQNNVIRRFQGKYLK
jgi:hypothetical protein